MTDTAAVQALINAAHEAGGGQVQLNTGTYCTPGLLLRPRVTLMGRGRGATLLQCVDIDASPLTLLEGEFHGVRDLSIAGRQSPSAQANTVNVNPGVVSATFRDLDITFGHSALYMAGEDCTFDNCCMGNSFGDVIVSNGANWYLRCKIDSVAEAMMGFKPDNYVAYRQGDANGGRLMENHFSMCDFSGDFDYSVFISDGNSTTITDFSGCVMSSKVNIGRAMATVLRGCEFGATVSNTNGHPLSVTGCYAVGSAIMVYGATAQAGNMNMAFA